MIYSINIAIGKILFPAEVGLKTINPVPAMDFSMFKTVRVVLNTDASRFLNWFGSKTTDLYPSSEVAIRKVSAGIFHQKILIFPVQWFPDASKMPENDF